MSEQRQATMDVAWELLRDALRLPESTELVRVELADPYTIRLVVADPDLPPIPEGCEPPRCAPTFRTRVIAHPGMAPYRTVYDTEFLHWGIAPAE